MARLNLYIPVGQGQLRCGYTTGSCAAGAVRAAAELLLNGEAMAVVSLMTPAGIPLELEIQALTGSGQTACCGIQKDGGDDPDVTDGVMVCARVQKTTKPGIRILGGPGVGRVTQKGLECPVGEAAINPIPRQMILAEAMAAIRRAGYIGGLEIQISIPEGEKLASRTFNPRLGIQGGLSILGTSGLVKPMSEKALLDAIGLEIKIRRESGIQDLILTPGNYGEQFAKKYLKLDVSHSVQCSNYLGEALDRAVGLGFRSILLIGHFGKLVKTAAGIMNTHSRTADGRREVMAAHAALCGAGQSLVRQIFEAATTDAAIELLQGAALWEPVMASIVEEIDGSLKQRTGASMEVEAILFTNQQGLLGKTKGADGLLARHPGGNG